MEFIITAKRCVITDTTAGCSRELFRDRSQGNYFLTFPLKSLIVSKSYITFVTFSVAMYYLIYINLKSRSVETYLFYQKMGERSKTEERKTEKSVLEKQRNCISMVA